MKIKHVQKHSRIGNQFVVIIAGVLLFALLSNAFFQFYKEKERSTNSLTQQGNSIGFLLTSISVDPLLVYDNYTVNEFARNTTQQENVIYAVYINKDNHAITHYIDSENPIIQKAIIATKTEDPHQLFNYLSEQSDILNLSFPVIFNDKLLATIKIGLDKKPLESIPFENLMTQVFSSLIFGLLIGVSIYIGFLKKVSHPIKKLKKSANKITSFKFDDELTIQGNNEFSELANTFNLMRITLKEAVTSKENTLKEMEQLNASLEDRVLKRTNELEKLNTQITHQAMHDPLTDLPNRTLIVEHLNQALTLAKRNNEQLAVFILDLNNFKDINDTLGHPEGDIILKQVAKRIPNALRESDSVGRLGGDEFAFVLPDINEDDAIKVGNKIVEVLKPSFNLTSQSVNIGASIGIAIFPEHGKDQASLIRHADVAMYESKRHETHVTLYNTSFDTHTPWRLELMADLREAIENDELCLHYQPQVNLKTNKVYGVEALLRWTHPKHGAVAPDQFIYIAENSGLINLLTNCVIRHSLLQINKWKEQGLVLDMSINISARNLKDKDFTENLLSLIEAHNSDPKRIKLEFTESTVMSNPDVVLSLLNHPKLKDLRYSIDDFGTGYSSLSYLKKLTVDEVKIDKSFVRDMDTNENDASIVQSVIDLTHNLGHLVVAEGVETQTVMNTLIDLGCDSVQGYYISKPLPAEKIPDFIKQYNTAVPLT
ncbi:diguanylate cyclase/phosphodiesterase (GGDEF & EAL domains) with PAS/PAC sensor(s) [hydrothermal vent metagenome]|uniref:Diguanylate cyclase/phosphodiesterase (GGDEF & EAL domains) with PAS/PAC sensor(S) n=1 Tax=hydrothermal vent metagenome TaxID=652676 RepID=A0A3B0X8B4_9ZZZZ